MRQEEVQSVSFLATETAALAKRWRKRPNLVVDQTMRQYRIDPLSNQPLRKEILSELARRSNASRNRKRKAAKMASKVPDVPPEEPGTEELTPEEKALREVDQQDAAEAARMRGDYDHDDTPLPGHRGSDDVPDQG